MRNYETMVIVHPELAGEAFDGVVEKLRGILEQQNAEILKCDKWGTRKLAYLVKKQARGTFLLLVYKASSEVIAEFERRMRIDDNILKFQTILLDEEPDLSEPVAAERQESGDSEVDVEEEVAEDEE